jgi:hypothetical protein
VRSNDQESRQKVGSIQMLTAIEILIVSIIMFSYSGDGVLKDLLRMLGNVRNKYHVAPDQVY